MAYRRIRRQVILLSKIKIEVLSVDHLIEVAISAWL